MKKFKENKKQLQALFPSDGFEKSSPILIV